MKTSDLEILKNLAQWVNATTDSEDWEQVKLARIAFSEMCNLLWDRQIPVDYKIENKKIVVESIKF